MKELAYVLDRRTSANISPDLGDFVTCCNCGRTMLVNIGTDSCPECEEHALMWTAGIRKLMRTFSRKIRIIYWWIPSKKSR